MHEAKEGDREGYRERVREIEGNRERDGEWEKYTHVGKHQQTIHKGKAWVNAKIGWVVRTFDDLWGRTYLNEIFAYS